jgi:hypothetical protein
MVIGGTGILVDLIDLGDLVAASGPQLGVGPRRLVLWKTLTYAPADANTLDREVSQGQHRCGGIVKGDGWGLAGSVDWQASSTGLAELSMTTACTATGPAGNSQGTGDEARCLRWPGGFPLGIIIIIIPIRPIL